MGPHGRQPAAPRPSMAGQSDHTAPDHTAGERAEDGVLIYGFQSILSWAQLALGIYAAVMLIDAAVRREDAYRAASKQTKGMWLIFLAIATALLFILPVMSFLPIIGVIAVIVYTVDVRPALRAVSGGGRGPRRGGSSSDGPYGPFNGGR
ncbi:membrane protein [Streptomyces nigrescens]|uniref:Membrane protein n=1 Tax=Streptomyces nigrescens TaxID=1920 RepID=A0ABN6R3K2_STRNI|nr:membrane protein [Streptomyces nigrescens]